ncbi:MAG: hypothetical protein FWE38_01705 [Firmicutes bacterium]|nr:hypothetical protein [Bacillota bacterium]
MGTKEEAFKKEDRKKKVQEMEVFTHAKRLCGYVFKATRNAPKQFRWNVVNKMTNSSIDVVDGLYRANDIKDDEARREVALRAIDPDLKILGYLGTLAAEVQMFTNKQTEHFAAELYATRQSLWKWIRAIEAKRKKEKSND